MSSNEVAIRVQNLSKCYEIYAAPRDRLKQFVLPPLQRLAGRPSKQYFREFWALKDVSFEIKKGETVGIIGRNGSGKSTLLQMICGTVYPTRGTLQTKGRIAALLELGAGFNPEFTGRENIYMNGAILGISNAHMDERLGSILSFSELGEFIDQPVKTYSSGMHARLAFSIAINVDPEILIVDEALAVGDSRFVAKCMRRIKDIQNQGATILFVSHDVGSVRTLCERSIWLDKGCMVEQGDVFPVTGRYMEFMYKDEESEAEALHDEIASQQPLAPSENKRHLLLEQDTPTVTNATATITADAQLRVPSAKMDARPVTHWGSHKGTIVSAAVLDERGRRKDVYAWGDILSIVIEVCIPKGIPREHLSVAFSIKNLKGTDLIVSTTHDFEILKLPEVDHFKIAFRLTNVLATGEYLLVAAVENRKHHDIHNYEYVEGSHYFSSLVSDHLFGIFHPKIEQQILLP